MDEDADWLVEFAEEAGFIFSPKACSVWKCDEDRSFQDGRYIC